MAPIERSYFVCVWHHDELGRDRAPCLLHFEIDAERLEVRKVETYADGSADAVGDGIQIGDSMASWEPIPPLDEINADRVFEAREIDRAEFERVWDAALKKHSRLER